MLSQSRCVGAQVHCGVLWPSRTPANASATTSAPLRRRRMRRHASESFCMPPRSAFPELEHEKSRARAEWQTCASWLDMQQLLSSHSDGNWRTDTSRATAGDGSLAQHPASAAAVGRPAAADAGAAAALPAPLRRHPAGPPAHRLPAAGAQASLSKRIDNFVVPRCRLPIVSQHLTLHTLYSHLHTQLIRSAPPGEHHWTLCIYPEFCVSLAVSSLQAIPPHCEFNHESAHQYLEASRVVEELRRNLCAELCNLVQFQVSNSFLDAAVQCSHLVRGSPALSCFCRTDLRRTDPQCSTPALQAVLWRNCLTAVQAAMSELSPRPCASSAFALPVWCFAAVKRSLQPHINSLPLGRAGAAFCRCSPEYFLDLVQLVNLIAEEEGAPSVADVIGRALGDAEVRYT